MWDAIQAFLVKYGLPMLLFICSAISSHIRKSPAKLEKDMPIYGNDN